MFIELTARNGAKVLVNMNQVELIESVEGSISAKVLMGFNSKEGLFVKESYEEIVKRINEAGKML